MYPSLGFLKQKNCVPFSIDVECETIIDDESKNIKIHSDANVIITTKRMKIVDFT